MRVSAILQYQRQGLARPLVATRIPPSVAERFRRSIQHGLQHDDFGLNRRMQGRVDIGRKQGGMVRGELRSSRPGLGIFFGICATQGQEEAGNSLRQEEREILRRGLRPRFYDVVFAKRSLQGTFEALRKAGSLYTASVAS